MSNRHIRLNTRHWAAIRRTVFNRDHWRCTSCGNAGRLECDHVKPLQRGGDPFDMSNLQTLCRSCHIEKTRRENRRPQTPAEAAWRALVGEMLRSSAQ
ncbi:MAG: HNH endonuclease signature motif containing protein [Rhodospirillaceae bacterium]|nr:HNH endonuclease signature motif containing protein [Rhodospirillaceae bacterium]